MMMRLENPKLPHANLPNHSGCAVKVTRTGNGDVGKKDVLSSSHVFRSTRFVESGLAHWLMTETYGMTGLDRTINQLFPLPPLNCAACPSSSTIEARNTPPPPQNRTRQHLKFGSEMLKRRPLLGCTSCQTCSTVISAREPRLCLAKW